MLSRVDEIISSLSPAEKDEMMIKLAHEKPEAKKPEGVVLETEKENMEKPKTVKIPVTEEQPQAEQPQPEPGPQPEEQKSEASPQTLNLTQDFDLSICKVVRPKTTNADRVYLVWGKEGIKGKRWVTSPQVLEKLGFTFADVEEMDDVELGQYLDGEPVREETNLF